MHTLVKGQLLIYPVRHTAPGMGGMRICRSWLEEIEAFTDTIGKPAYRLKHHTVAHGKHLLL